MNAQESFLYPDRSNFFYKTPLGDISFHIILVAVDNSFSVSFTVIGPQITLRSDSAFKSISQYPNPQVSSQFPRKTTLNILNIGAG